MNEQDYFSLASYKEVAGWRDRADDDYRVVILKLWEVP